MAVEIHKWPASLTPRSGGFFKRGQTAAGAPSLSGLIQVGQIDAGYWSAQYGAIPLASPTTVRAYRAFMARLGGGGALVRVPVFDTLQTPWNAPGGVQVKSATETEYSDGSRFTDATGFAERAIVIDLQAAAARGATQIVATVTTAATIEGGEYFTLGERLHVISEILSVSGSNQTWKIWPKLRQAYAAGTKLDFDNPGCLMRLSGETEGDLTLEYGQRGFPDVGFVEAFTAADLV